MVGSYLIEGHTAAAADRYILVPALFIHLLVVHWWLGALLPLRAVLGNADIAKVEAADIVHRFGQQAVVAVGLLVVAGALLLAFLTNWQLDYASAYQQGFAVKLAVFLFILLVAAVNKLRLTTLVSVEPERGRMVLRRAISLEVALAFTILAATAIGISFPPAPH